jgi:uncharacterized protein YycO
MKGEYLLKKIIVIIFILLFFGDTVSAIKIDDLNVTSIKEVTNKISGIADLKLGDILFQFSQYIAMHCIIFKQYNSTNKTYEFIEANSEQGVRRIFYSENELNNTIIYKKFARVKNANATQKQNAILFAESQIGKEFELDFLFHNKNNIPDSPDDPFSNSWYCTELVWAAYYNCNHSPEEKIYGQGIDIDRNEWRKDSLIYSMVWPNNIIWDDDIEVFYLRENLNN